MLLVIYIITLLFLAIFLSLKNMKFLKIILFIGVLLLIITNRWSNDYEGYATLLYNTPEVYAEKGYQVLINLIKIFSGNFRWVLYLISILYFMIRKKTILKEGKINVEVLYLLYPFILDLNQWRNTLMYFCFVLAIYSKSKIKKIWLLVVGTSFQILGVVYLIINLLLKIKIERIKKYWKRLYFLTLILSFKLNKIIIFLPNNNLFYRIKTKLLYYTREFNIETLFLWGGIVLVDIYVFDYLYKKINVLEIEQKIFFEKVYKTILLLGIISPLFTVVIELNRTYRNIFLLKYIVISLFSKKMNKLERLIIYSVMLSINILLLGYLDFKGIKIIRTIFSWFYIS